MTSEQLTYLVFGIVMAAALTIDLGLLSKKSTTISLSKALWQTVFWVLLAIGFFGFLWFENGHVIAMEYLSAYFMEWSLSIDNIFVFILIFSFFGVKDSDNARILLIGILIAIVLRILFITVGIGLVERFHWLLYVFGGILIITGIRMFISKKDDEQDLSNNKIYQLLLRFLPVTTTYAGSKFMVTIQGKRYFTNMFLVVIVIATTDIIFALDSIPAVFAISQRRIVIYTSNIFAVLGLRSLFFLLKNAVNKFDYLPQGIAVVLVFVGLKMFAELFGISVPVYVSLLVIFVCIAASVVYSISRSKALEAEDNLLNNSGNQS